MRLTKCVPLGVGFKLAWAVFIQTKISKMLRFLASCVTVATVAIILFPVHSRIGVRKAVDNTLTTPVLWPKNVVSHI
jgi:hypothetical protein